MCRVCWPLVNERPVIQVTFLGTEDGQEYIRTLLADTGGGRRNSHWDVILSVNDCRLFGLDQAGMAHLVGAYTGDFPMVSVQAALPALPVIRELVAVAVPSDQVRPGTDGLAGFRFLSAFHYGNFGDPEQFGLELL
jgi:hypothetical protein